MEVQDMIESMENAEESAQTFISKARQKSYWKICVHCETHLESSSRVQIVVSSKQHGLGQNEKKHKKYDRIKDPFYIRIFM